MATPSLKFWPWVSREGSTDIQQLLPKKGVDLWGLRIKNNEETQIDTKTWPWSVVKETTSDFNVSGLEQTWKDFALQTADFWEVTTEELPTFNIEPKKSVFDTIADKLIPKTEATELNDTKIESFIQWGIDRWLSKEELRVGFETAKNQWRFNIQIQEDIEITKDIEPEIEKKPSIWEVIANESDAFDVIIGWIKETGINVFESAKQVTKWFLSAADKLTDQWALSISNSIRNFTGKEELSEEEFKQINPTPEMFNETLSEDLLDVWQGSLQLWITTLFPVATLAFTTAWETSEWEAVLDALGTAITAWWGLITKIPWLSDYRESLPEERRADFDAFVWQGTTLWLFKAWSKIGEIKAKWNKANEVAKTSDTAGKILRPTKTEVQKWVLESWEKWLITIAKKTGKEVKDFEWLSKSVPKVKQEAFAPLKKWLDDAQAKLFRTEKTWLTKDSSVTFALEQLKDITEWLGSKKMQPLQKEISFLIKKNEGKWLTLNEIQRVKQLHTENNSLFTDKWEVRGKTISREDLREVRNDIKKVLEDRSIDWGFKKVNELNTKYGEILNAEQLIKQRAAEVKATWFKTETPGILGKTVWFILDLPIIAQTLTQVWQWIFNKFNRGSAGRSISIIELEAQLPKLLKELRQSWEPKGNISKIVWELKKTYPALSEEALDFNE